MTKPISICGYTQRKSVTTGQNISFKVSVAGDKPYVADLVRIIAGDPNPESTGIIVEKLSSNFEGRYSGVYQPTHPGSFGVVECREDIHLPVVFCIGVNIWPTRELSTEQSIMVIADREKQPIASLSVIDRILTGKLHNPDGRPIEVCASIPLKTRRWYQVKLVVDTENGSVNIEQSACQPCFPLTLDDHSELKIGKLLIPEFRYVQFASAHAARATSSFNGKLEKPFIFRGPEPENSSAAELIACWDFSQEMHSQVIRDTGPNQLDGRLVNAPMRAMTGSNWDATVHCWTHAPDQYGAIHFHDDDLSDAGWEDSFTFQVPANMRSGVYGARVSTDTHEDIIPFFVRRPLGSPTAGLALWIPTFSYEVYANFVRLTVTDKLINRIREWGGREDIIWFETGFGLSCYNEHSDGSAVCLASSLRPDLTFRPGYLSYLDERGSGMRHFSADLHLVSWLEKYRKPYDIITDHDVDEEGANLLNQYDVVMTGTHPEYQTENNRNALIEYQAQGGRFVYLAGNGFYWRLVRSHLNPELLEMRRPPGGTRANFLRPGEYYNAFDGKLSGLWRDYGKDPQQILGIGFAGYGGFYGQPYHRSELSYEDKYQWIFQGIESKTIGAHGFSGGGAAGFELDRMDEAYGSPSNTKILATYIGDPDRYHCAVEEEIANPLKPTVAGLKREEIIRSDMVFFTTPNNGAVFSAGSITFCGSLPTNDFDNDISRLLNNVVSRFLNPEPFPDD